MTRQTYEDLYEKAKRIGPEVEKAMADRDAPEWGVEYEIPATTNGWVYYGDCGAPATSANWGDTFPGPTEAVGVLNQSTHPRDDTAETVEVFHVPDMDEKTEKTMIDTFEGPSGKTPLYVDRRLFWQAVEAAIVWMNRNPPGE